MTDGDVSQRGHRMCISFMEGSVDVRVAWLEVAFYVKRSHVEQFKKLTQLAAWAAVMIFLRPAIASFNTIKVAFLEVCSTRGNLARLEPSLRSGFFLGR